MHDYEKLGLFYLGRQVDAKKQETTNVPLLYDSRDLTTHAVCVGMTGSGKTGLCISLLEEATIDGIPSIVIDPKGDLSNLLLTFPNLQPADFRPWIDESEALRKTITPDEMASEQAELWRKGLEGTDQDGARIQLLKDAAEFVIYTPGSTVGVPVSIASSFAPPEADGEDPAQAIADQAASTASSLLGLLNIDADPLQSREHILLSTILTKTWQAGQSIELKNLVGLILNPGIEQIGVVDLDSFFPPKDRSALAMRVNNLLASPQFANWLTGVPLNVGKMLYTKEGKPRVNVFSISHLSDEERMFFVSLLLNQVVAWMRTQSGTSSLRALVYMDEIFGYLPPVANPPSKQPLMMLLKQARAFGVGIVLATQNPVDLDYKALSNCGTWFIGRLQTERDRKRLLDGLKSASNESSNSFDEDQMESLLARLGNRMFLMNNVHDDHPTFFQTRWALSYLRGPLSRQQIQSLMAPVRQKLSNSASQQTTAVTGSNQGSVPQSQSSVGLSASSGSTSTTPTVTNQNAPVLDATIPQYYLPVTKARSGDASLTYDPMLLGLSRIYINDARNNVSQQQDVAYVAEFQPPPVLVDWQLSQSMPITSRDLSTTPSTSASFQSLPGDAAKPKNVETWKKSLADWLFHSYGLTIYGCPALKEVSQPGESQRDFAIRLQHTAREARDDAADKLKASYASKFTTLKTRLQKAQQAVEVQAEQARQAKLQTALSVGTTFLGAIFGRRTMSAGNIGKAATAMRGAGRSIKESQDIGRAQESKQGIQQQLSDLDRQLQTEIAELDAKFNALNESIEPITLRPKKTDITVQQCGILWMPVWQNENGPSELAWSR